MSTLHPPSLTLRLLPGDGGLLLLLPLVDAEVVHEALEQALGQAEPGTGS